MAAPETALTGGTAELSDVSDETENCRHVRCFLLSSLGESSPESESAEKFEDSEAVELADKVLLRLISEYLCISTSPFIAALYSSIDAVSEAVVDGIL